MATGTLIPSPVFTGLDNNGAIVPGGKLYTYLAGTTTNQATYTDVALTVPNANPIVLDSAGRAVVYVPSGSSFKLVLKTAADVTLWTRDNVAAVPSSTTEFDITGVFGEAVDARDVVYLSDGSGGLTAGRWYIADADNTYGSSDATLIGMVPEAVALAATGTIRLGGRITGLTGLTAGTRYYVSATAGALTSSAPTNVWLVGKADSTTSLVLTQNQGGAWVPSQVALDFLYASTASQVGRLAVGTALQQVRVNAGATAYEFFTPTAVSAPVVRQIVTATYATEASSSSSTPADTGLTATITPTSASNKILVFVNQAGVGKVNNTMLALTLLRGATGLMTFAQNSVYTGSTATLRAIGCSAVYLDSPATDSAVTYKTQFTSNAAIATTYVQQGSSASSIALVEVTP